MVKAYTDRYNVLELGGVSMTGEDMNKRTGSGDLGEKGSKVREEKGMQNGLALWPVLRDSFSQDIPQRYLQGKIPYKNVGFWTHAEPSWVGFSGARVWPGQHH